MIPPDKERIIRDAANRLSTAAGGGYSDAIRVLTSIALGRIKFEPKNTTLLRAIKKNIGYKHPKPYSAFR